MAACSLSVKHVLSPAMMLPLSSPSPKRPDPRVCWVSPEDALHRLQPGRRWWESSESALETAKGGASGEAEWAGGAPGRLQHLAGLEKSAGKSPKQKWLYSLLAGLD